MSANKQRESAIAVFDSGIGGLTVLHALRQVLPHENFIYLGDTARLPYGSKSTASIQRYALQAAQYLLQYDVKLLILACNTATAGALSLLHKTFPDLPIFGVVEPGALAAIHASKRNRIGVLCTQATKKSNAYQEKILEHKPEAEVFTYSAPLLVPLAEEGWTSGELTSGILQHYLQPILQHDIDCLVLGCTHYPVFFEMLRELIDRNIQIVDSAQTTAQATRQYLEEARLLNPQSGKGEIHFYSTDDPQKFAQVGSLFLGEAIATENVQLVDL